MDADLDTLATALYARIDDLLLEHPELAPWRPKVGIAPKLSDAELLTLAVLQVLQGYAGRPDGCVTPTGGYDRCFRTCPDSPTTTSGCTQRLHGYCGDVPPVEFEAAYAAPHTDQQLVGNQ